MLDTPLALESELPPPSNAFRPQSYGSIEFDLLINELGEVIWISPAIGTIDSETSQLIAKGFLAAQFSKPTMHGRETKVLIRIEVSLDPSTAN